MNIFVTGGAGFIGKRLVSSLLEEGHAVYVLARKKDAAIGLKHPNITLIQGSLENPSEYKDVFDNHIDIVYHLAAIPGQKWGFKEADYQKVNVQGTKHLLELSRGKIKKFIFCSSINAIENSAGFHIDPYGKSKLEAEELVKKENSFETMILRPAVVYGPQDTGGLFLKMCLMIKKGVLFVIGPGKNIIPLVYIDDLVSAFLKAKDISKNKQVYEIVGTDNISIEKIVGIISGCLGVSPPKIKIPIRMARAAASVSEAFSIIFKKEPVVTNHRVDIMTKNNPLSSEKAQRELGFEPQMEFAKGIDLTIKWYQKNGFI
jgi:nucleoside-diphosphate-sugar epimerase